ENFISECGYPPTRWDTRLAGNSLGLRDLAATTPQAVHPMTFYHPRAQETLLEAGEKGGVEVKIGGRVVGVEPGAVSRVMIQGNGGTDSYTARLVVGADGRGSMGRKWGGFESQGDPHPQRVSGIL